MRRRWCAAPPARSWWWTCLSALMRRAHRKPSAMPLGWFRSEWAAFEEDARAVAEAGAFAVVLEALAELLAARITKQISIPTIGLGASAECDGQILVLEGLSGLSR